MELRIRTETEGSRCIVHLEGTCDLATIPELRSALMPLSPPDVTNLVVDVSDLEFCDSTGLGTMLGALRRMREAGGEFAISGARGTVLRLLEITGLDKIVTLIP